MYILKVNAIKMKKNLVKDAKGLKMGLHPSKTLPN